MRRDPDGATRPSSRQPRSKRLTHGIVGRVRASKHQQAEELKPRAVARSEATKGNLVTSPGRGEQAPFLFRVQAL